MNDFYNLWINKLGYVNIIILIVAGYLIVSSKKRTQQLALWLYLISNLILFIRGYVTSADSFIVASFIFGGLSAINLYRVNKRKE